MLRACALRDPAWWGRRGAVDAGKGLAGRSFLAQGLVLSAGKLPCCLGYDRRSLTSSEIWAWEKSCRLTFEAPSSEVATQGGRGRCGYQESEPWTKADLQAAPRRQVPQLFPTSLISECTRVALCWEADPSVRECGVSIRNTS